MPRADAPQPVNKRTPARRAAEGDEEDQWVEVTHEPGFLELFTAGEIRCTGQSFQERHHRYRLFIPETSGPDDKLPLIVWLHGKGEAGQDNSSHLRHLSTLIFTKPWQRERYPFFLLALQCPRDNPGWTATGHATYDMLDVLMGVLNKILEEYPIDRDRITLGGISSGGSGSWELAIRQPDLFAAVAPLGSAGANDSPLDGIVHVPIWAFHSTKDLRTSVKLVRETVAALESAGGNVRLTEVNLREHDCWHAAFERYELLSWLLAQRRGDPSRPPPGSISVPARLRLAWIFISSGWTLPQLAGQIGIPLLLIVAIWSARRQRRLRLNALPVPESDA